MARTQWRGQKQIHTHVEISHMMEVVLHDQLSNGAVKKTRLDPYLTPYPKISFRYVILSVSGIL